MKAGRERESGEKEANLRVSPITKPRLTLECPELPPKLPFLNQLGGKGFCYLEPTVESGRNNESRQ